jgi:hypothetical protein
VPPCIDVYVLIRSDDRAAELARFARLFLDARQVEPRFDAFRRAFISASPLPGDAQALDELRRHDAVRPALSIYLQARDFHAAVIAITAEGALVLGLSIDDPHGSADAVHQAGEVISRLSEHLEVEAAIAGVELAPPESLDEWRSDDMVLLRVGDV